MKCKRITWLESAMVQPHLSRAAGPDVQSGMNNSPRLLTDGTLRAYNCSTLHPFQLELLSTVFDGYSNNIPALDCRLRQEELQIKDPAAGGYWAPQTPHQWGDTDGEELTSSLNLIDLFLAASDLSYSQCFLPGFSFTLRDLPAPNEDKQRSYSSDSTISCGCFLVRHQHGSKLLQLVSSNDSVQLFIGRFILKQRCSVDVSLSLNRIVIFQIQPSNFQSHVLALDTYLLLKGDDSWLDLLQSKVAHSFGCAFWKCMMDAVSPELNSLLPDEIMDTEAIPMEEELPAEHLAPPPQSESNSVPVPMETEVPEIVSMCPVTTSVQVTTTSTVTKYSSNSGAQLVLAPSSNMAVSTTTTTTSTSSSTKTTSAVVTQNLAKISSITLPANQQLIINKVTNSPGADGKLGGATLLKPEGQKLLVAGLSKSGQPIMLTLPHNWNKPAASQGDGRAQPTQIKMVTAVGKPVITVSSASQLVASSAPQPAQQLKTLQITKKPPVSTAGPMITKLILTKALNNKGLSSSASMTPVVTGRVVTPSTPVTPPRAITIGEAISTGPQNPGPNSKVAISPLKSPSKLTVVSVASQSQNSPQKSVTLPLNLALGQQILTVQQSAATSPAKAGSSQSSTQSVKPVQTVAVGGVGASQFKAIIPLTTPPNVQQIQVPGSRFHYVRLVTATTASNTAQTGASTNTNTTLQSAKPVMMNAAVRMSVPFVPAQSVKQVVPKPLTSATQVVTTSQTPQRLIMPATHLPQIQPNLTNLPPGTVIAPAHGSGNMGYAVLPAPYVTQIPQQAFVTLTSGSSFSTASPIQTQARLSLNGYCDCFANGEFCSNCNCVNCFNNLDHESERLKAIKACLDRNPVAFKPKIGKGKEGEADRRHSKGCNCKKSGCLKNYCECYEAKIMCSSICKCMGCKNFEESLERKTLMHLADAAEVRVQQQTAAKTKLSSQISDLLTRTTPAITSGGGKLPYTFVTKEVAAATCDCMLEEAEQAELNNQPQALAERLILEEFGRCLRRIISFAGKAKSDCSVSC
ncbi:hypothetical protein DNTS_027866 [Danionella cerebrum]|uniref:CRC domain-containing protein n=1 Tax=Danionella cerebrum TaxID=2873325 RepID=A0A553QX48_9TELE|nr:hypothetical protein DNTS_027866 [Danionella translucida]